jgi:hypothetical protein
MKPHWQPCSSRIKKFQNGILINRRNRNSNPPEMFNNPIARFNTVLNLKTIGDLKLIK